MSKRTYRSTPEPRFVYRAKIADNAGEATPESIMAVLEGGLGIVVDESETGEKVEIHLDMTNAVVNSLLVAGSTGKVSLGKH